MLFKTPRLGGMNCLVKIDVDKNTAVNEDDVIRRFLTRIAVGVRRMLKMDYYNMSL